MEPEAISQTQRFQFGRYLGVPFSKHERRFRGFFPTDKLLPFHTLVH